MFSPSASVPVPSVLLHGIPPVFHFPINGFNTGLALSIFVYFLFQKYYTSIIVSFSIQTAYKEKITEKEEGRKTMQIKTTGELLQKIKKMKKNEIGLLAGKDFSSPQIHIYLTDLLNGYGISNKDFFDKMELERSYGYQILNGRRRPSRELLIKTAIYLHLDLDETQRLLKIGNREILYPRVRADAVAIFVIEKELSLSEYQELIDNI